MTHALHHRVVQGHHVGDAEVADRDDSMLREVPQAGFPTTELDLERLADTVARGVPKRVP